MLRTETKEASIREGRTDRRQKIYTLCNFYTAVAEISIQRAIYWGGLHHNVALSDHLSGEDRRRWTMRGYLAKSVPSANEQPNTTYNYLQTVGGIARITESLRFERLEIKWLKNVQRWVGHGTAER